ncbi:MAG: prolipoprotein diacylglyceryl transferase family protein [Anaerolineae bacterium]|jgi:prolipoprotein diacylglyceryltransferase|uniref:prolipoprotein diacylglyceryl transferase n=1 Tax=Candidatus Amarolinea dominans TaxID=3140696 RepID=UPI0031358574|nr:prolipoprotein diacylglyceryl transferase [Anaerolineae bacterium]MBK9092517.1 prolipoprotein diacylglyceryl transferase [Anaerolineae bacterium]
MLRTILIAGVSLPLKPLLALAALYAALWLAARLARRRGLDGDHLWNLGFVSAIAALVGGRVAYVLQFWPAYQQDPLAIFSVRPGTLAWTPGLLIGLLAGLLYVRRLHLPLTTVLDALAPGALLGLAILSLADFLAGDAYGTPTTLPWAVELWGARRHPVQLYQLGAQLAALFLVLRRPATWPGQPCVFGENAGLTLFLYALSRLLFDAFRGDSLILAGGFRAEQIGALAVALLALPAALAAPPQAEVSTPSV